MIKSMGTPESLWLMRKQFALQTATVMFLTFVCSLSNRTPSRFHLSRKTGMMYMTEILPGKLLSITPQSITDLVQLSLKANLSSARASRYLSALHRTCSTSSHGSAWKASLPLRLPLSLDRSRCLSSTWLAL